MFYVPTYPTGMWSFQYGVKGDTDMKVVKNQNEADAFVNDKKLKYYNTELHTASFALPNFVKTLLK